MVGVHFGKLKRGERMEVQGIGLGDMKRNRINFDGLEIGRRQQAEAHSRAKLEHKAFGAVGPSSHIF